MCLTNRTCFLGLIYCIFATTCATPPPTAYNSYKVSVDTELCQEHCAEFGMELKGVNIRINSVDVVCVCEIPSIN